MADQLLLYQKFYDVVIWLYPMVNRIPKSHRQVMGKHIEELCITLLLAIIKANKTRGADRVTLQASISDDLDSLRILIRLSKDLRFLSIKQYTVAAEKLNEVARMFTSWANATK